jgi:hypothetical protein
MKTSELTGTALDWAVAKCLGIEWWAAEDPRDGLFFDRDRTMRFSPSTNWNQSGPIIEQESIGISLSANGCWQAHQFDPEDDLNAAFYQTGTAPLIAAMRCYVASKLGDEVGIPDELAP